MKLFDLKSTIIIASFILTVILYFVIFRPVYEVIKYKHNAVFNDYQRYLWLLDENVILKDMGTGDPNFSVCGQERKWDQYFNYNLKDDIYVHILEFVDLEPLMVSKISFNFQDYYGDSFDKGVNILNEEVQSFPKIIMKNELPFQNNLIVSYNENAQLQVIKDTTNCRAYFGNLNEMVLSNGSKTPLVLFDFSDISKALIAFYSYNSRFFLIMITSDHDLNSNCINLLNLD